VLLTGGGRADGASLEHTCSATDRQFIRVAALNIVGVGMTGDSYRSGDSSAKRVVAEARAAAARVDRLQPRDPSLVETREMLAVMFTEYARAMAARANDRPAGRHMYRAYQVANFAHAVLVDAEPELRRRGCDVSGLL